MFTGGNDTAGDDAIDGEIVTGLSEVELAVCHAIEEQSDKLISLAARLIGFDTTSRYPEDPARDEQPFQEYLADRCSGAGARVELWEPRRRDVSGRQCPGGLDFEGRPQMLAEFGCSEVGGSLLFNGHIDAVSYEPRDRWASDPLTAEVRNGRLYGRGACDMKGGVAAMVFAAEKLAELEVPLGGRLLVNTVTDEESSGAGGIASVAHGVQADAGVIPEPTGFDVWLACRGTLTLTIIVPGRPGHAEVTQPHWRQGGAVNAIEKAQLILTAIARLREEWRLHADHQHPHSRPAAIVPTKIEGGEWHVSYPASCTITVEIAYPPSAADEGGWGDTVRSHIIAAIETASASDPWLADNPPVLKWAEEFPAAVVGEETAVSQAAARAAADVGRPGRFDGLDSWHDGATFIRNGCPTVCLGPGDITVAHTINEYVRIVDLVRCCQALALIAIRFRGPA